MFLGLISFAVYLMFMDAEGHEVSSNFFLKCMHTAEDCVERFAEISEHGNRVLALLHAPFETSFSLFEKHEPCRAASCIRTVQVATSSRVLR